jgi:serine/threonine-protein kinase HipA
VQAQQRALLATSGSLGGAKPKAAIAIEGEEWVLKFYNGEPFDLPLVEHATGAQGGP